MQLGEIKDQILNIYRKHLGYFLSASFIIVISILFVFALNLLFPGMIFIGFCLLIIPLCTCFMINNSFQFTSGKPFRLENFYQGYRLSLLPGLHGSYRFIRAFLISILVFFIGVIILYSVGSLFMDLQDRYLIDLLQADHSDYEVYIQNIYKYLDDPSAFYVQVYSIICTISFGFASMYFIHATLSSSILFYIQSSLGCSKRDAMQLQRKVSSQYKKTYFRLILKTCSKFFLLFPLGYGLGLFLGLMFGGQLEVMLFSALAVGLLFSFPFLPLFLLSQEFLFQIFLPEYKKNARPIFESAIRNINLDPRIAEEKKQILRQFYLIQLQEIEELEKKDILTSAHSQEEENKE